jgi:membrane glycosyltransferase
MDSTMRPTNHHSGGSRRQAAFITALVLATAALWLVTGAMLRPEPGARVWAFAWLGLFCWLCPGLAYMLVTAIAALATRTADVTLPEAPEAGDGSDVALLVCVRNEPAEMDWGANARETMAAAIAAGLRPHLWVLSNSTPGGAAHEYEQKLIAQLQETFGHSSVGYFHSGPDEDLKHVRIAKWLAEHPDYEYLVPCDVDSVLPSDFLPKMLRKARCDANADVAVFQSELRVAPRPTRFAEYLGRGQELGQRVYTAAWQWVFGRAMFYGSGALLRRRLFEQVQAPPGVLSHDLWETALLDGAGYRTVFCPDVHSYESFPASLLEALRRDRRWCRGVLEMWRVPFSAGPSLSTRLMLGLSLYSYLSQPVFVLWVFLGLLATGPWGRLWGLQGVGLLGLPALHVEASQWFLGLLLLVFLHRAVAVRDLREAWYLVRELICSVLVYLNNLVYGSYNVLSAWLPTPWRTTRDTASPSLVSCAKALWPSTVLGIAGLVAGAMLSPVWLLAASPILISWALSIPLVLYTAQPTGDGS